MSAALGIGLLLVSLACVSDRATIPDPLTRLRFAEQLARDSGFLPLKLGVDPANELPTAAWVRTGSQRTSEANSAQHLHIYIEGDGLAWKSRREVSEDPTPARAIALMLAAADPTSATVVYLGRPCQYGMPAASECRTFFWTTARYGDNVIDAMNRSLDRIIENLDFRGSIDLIGFSGGGVVAALLSARRDDIRRLVTVAAPLDIALWTKTLRVSPLLASNSPMDQLNALRRIHQHHFVGRDDESVPASVTEAFHLALGKDAPSRLTVVEGINHGSWAVAWPRLARESGLAN